MKFTVVVAASAHDVGLLRLAFLDDDARAAVAVALRASRTAEVLVDARLAADRVLAT